MVGKYFCMAPFTHLAIDAQSRVRPCCMFYPTIYDKEYKSITDIFDSDENKNLRQKMLDGEKILECNKCYIDESIGKESYRLRFNKRYYSEKNIVEPKIKELELALGNKCNLRCVTCNGYYSSAWEKTDKILNNLIPRKIHKKPSVSIDDNFLDYDFSELKELKILGGEPFMYPEYVNFFEKLSANNITLFLVTNATFFPKKEFLDSILKFKKIKINISIDGIDDVGEFVRYGIKFSKFEKNFKRWLNISENVPKLKVIPHLVIHNFNILSINDTYKWLRKFFDTDCFLSYDFLDSPEYLNIKYLPKSTKKIILDYVKNGFFNNLVENFLGDAKQNNEVNLNFLKYYNFLNTVTEIPEISKIIIKDVKKNVEK